MSIIATYAPAVEQLCELIADMDVLVALAHVASNAPTPYVRPLLTDAGTGDLVSFRRGTYPDIACVDVDAWLGRAGLHNERKMGTKGNY